MKAINLFLISIILVLCASVFVHSADETSVYVTISDENGKIVLTYDSVSVTDVDDDGALTINDALYCAHERYYDGGAAAGYEAEQTEYGLSLTKLWGCKNGGAMGYYLNNTSPMSLSDTVSDGDSIVAFVYTDTTGFSDTFAFFNEGSISVQEGTCLSLTLSSVGFDEEWNTVNLPVCNANILIDGSQTDLVTDTDGKVEIRFESAGKFIVSAVSKDVNLVTPICIVEVTASETATSKIVSESENEALTDKTTSTTNAETAEDSAQTGDSSSILFTLSMAMLIIASVTASIKKYENR